MRDVIGTVQSDFTATGDETCRICVEKIPAGEQATRIKKTNGDEEVIFCQRCLQRT